jgi:RNA polymerase sigma-70 factor (ECF subfamily)
MLGNHQEAEEAVKESFVRIWHRAAEYDSSRASPFVWGFTILRAVCIDRLRHQNRQKQNVMRNAAATLLSPAPPPSESSFLPTESFRLARRAVNHLPLDERRCLELAVFLEYAQTETPTALDTRADNVLDRVQDALASLRTINQDSSP